jgi:hypothetical protein
MILCGSPADNSCISPQGKGALLPCIATKRVQTNNWGYTPKFWIGFNVQGVPLHTLEGAEHYTRAEETGEEVIGID